MEIHKRIAKMLREARKRQADGRPKEGIYYWVPVPGGDWELFPSYADTDPMQEGFDDQRKLQRLHHPLIWSVVVGFFADRWGLPHTETQALINKYGHTVFPRGRVGFSPQGIWAIGKGDDPVPNSEQRIEKAFNLNGQRIKVMNLDEHWAFPEDQYKQLAADIQRQFGVDILSGKALQSNINRFVWRGDSDQYDNGLRALIAKLEKADKLPIGKLDYFQPTQLDRDGQLWLQKTLPIQDLELATRPDSTAIDRAKEEINAKTGKIPLVFPQGDQYLVRDGEARIEAAKQLGFGAARVMVAVGYFSNPPSWNRSARLGERLNARVARISGRSHQWDFLRSR